MARAAYIPRTHPVAGYWDHDTRLGAVGGAVFIVGFWVFVFWLVG